MGSTWSRRPDHKSGAAGATSLTIGPADRSCRQRLELLRESFLVSAVQLCLMLASPSRVEMGEVQAAVRTLGIEVAPLEIREQRYAPPSSAQGRADALYIVVNALVFANAHASSRLRSALATTISIPANLSKPWALCLRTKYPTCSGAP